jgi:cell division protein FtsZ
VQRPSVNVERAALAAIAAAVETPAAAPIQPASYGDVTVRPIAQKPSLFPDHGESARIEPEQPATPETFIPQAAERAPLRAPRMPKFEELPMPAQAEIRQAHAEDDHPQKSKLSLLQRLANVGLGRRDEESEPPIAARAAGPAMGPLPERKPQRTVAQQMAANQDPVSEYAKRPAPQGLDAHGRPAPVAAAPQGDDHLDIPAFLRRQAN